jgi:hypothetical protein
MARAAFDVLRHVDAIAVGQDAECQRSGHVEPRRRESAKAPGFLLPGTPSYEAADAVAPRVRARADTKLLHEECVGRRAHAHDAPAIALVQYDPARFGERAFRSSRGRRLAPEPPHTIRHERIRA